MVMRDGGSGGAGADRARVDRGATSYKGGVYRDYCSGWFMSSTVQV